MKLIAIALILLAATAGSQPLQKSASFCGPIPAVCYPTTVSGGMGIGIFHVALNQINNVSSNPPMLEDFTCTDSTWLNTGMPYLFEVQTGLTYEESVTAWIDFGNDGNFDPAEIVYHDSALVYLHSGYITIPSGAVNSFTPIRMRVGSDYSGGLPLNGCNNATYGQYEDYTIYYGLGIGIAENENNSAVTVYPDPFNASASLNLAGKMAGSEALLTIYDCTGQEVQRQKIDPEKATIRRNNLMPGIYFFEIRSSGTIAGRGKFVIE